MVNLDYDGWEEWLQERNAERRIAFVVPLSFQDYGVRGCALDAADDSCTIKGPFADRVNGLAILYRDALLEEYSTKIVTASARANAESVARQEVATYSAYLQGNVYGYVVLDSNGEHIDSCWGYVGDSDYAMSEARGHVDAVSANLAAKHATALIAGI